MVPGYVVLSRMIAWPERSVRFTASVAATMKLTSGSLNLESGVGTQMEMASASARRSMSLVALKRPSLTAACSWASLTSFTCERPALRPSTTFCWMSNPSTRKPALASSTASGSPT